MKKYLYYLLFTDVVDVEVFEDTDIVRELWETLKDNTGNHVLRQHLSFKLSSFDFENKEDALHYLSELQKKYEMTDMKNI